MCAACLGPDTHFVSDKPGTHSVAAVAAAFSKLKQDAAVEGSDAQKTWEALELKFKEYQQSYSSRAAAAHAPAAAGIRVCEGFTPVPSFDLCAAQVHPSRRRTHQSILTSSVTCNPKSRMRKTRYSRSQPPHLPPPLPPPPSTIRLDPKPNTL